MLSMPNLPNQFDCIKKLKYFQSQKKLFSRLTCKTACWERRERWHLLRCEVVPARSTCAWRGVDLSEDRPRVDPSEVWEWTWRDGRGSFLAGSRPQCSRWSEWEKFNMQSSIITQEAALCYHLTSVIALTKVSFIPLTFWSKAITPTSKHR